MRLTENRTTRIGAALLSGGLLLGSGSCVPDNFLIDTWGGVLTSAADAAIATFVLDPMFATDAEPLQIELVEGEEE